MDEKTLTILCWLRDRGVDGPREDVLKYINHCGLDTLYAEYLIDVEKTKRETQIILDAFADLHERTFWHMYRCWKCTHKFKARDGHKHICPKCQTNLDEE